MNSETSFGEWVRRRRKALDLTQEKLAELVGCSASAIRKIEIDERRPSLQIAELLATHLEIPTDQKALFLRVARRNASVDKLPASTSGLNAPLPAALETASVSEAFIPPTNLPNYPTPFLGREQEISTLTKMLNDPHCRLITLLGQGGMGKTRLSVAVASSVLSLFEGRVYFVQLVSIASPDAILPAIAAIFGFTSSGNVDLKARLLSYLRDKNILLVLDNFEQLIEGATILTDLLSQAPQIKLLITSRERLNLQGEWTLELSGLSAPPESADQLQGHYDALDLFEQSVHRVKLNYPFTEQDRGAAIRICNLVDGLPLALELAATWSNVLSCIEIADEIEKGFDFLKTSLRDVPQRHKSLRAVFEHSWSLLSPEEQRVLASLSMFRGGFDRESAQAIAEANLETLANLIAKSLLRRTEDGRFDMHEAIRQYAALHLEDEQAVRTEHGEYFLAWLAGSEPALKGKDQFNILRSLTADFGNLQLAWEWGVHAKSLAALDAAVRSLWLAYDIRGRIREGVDQTEALVNTLRLEPVNKPSQIYLGRALAYHAMFCFRLGDYARARKIIEESIALLRPLAVPQLLPDPLIFSGIITSLMGDLPFARANTNEGTELAKRFNDTWFLALGELNQGIQAGFAGEREEAFRLMQSAVVLYRQMGNARFVGFALNFLSPIAIELNRLEEAHAFLNESLQLTTMVKDRWGMGTALNRLGMLSMLEGDFTLANEYLQKSINLFTELGARGDLATSFTQLGKLNLRRNELDMGQKNLVHAIRLGLEANTIPQALDAALDLAECFLLQGKNRETFTLLWYVEQNPVASAPALQQRVVTLKIDLDHKLPITDQNAVAHIVPMQELEKILAEQAAKTDH